MGPTVPWTPSSSSPGLDSKLPMSTWEHAIQLLATNAPFIFCYCFHCMQSVIVFKTEFGKIELAMLTKMCIYLSIFMFHYILLGILEDSIL